jgi:hypothetical protein
MITNEDLLMNYPGQWSAFTGTIFQIDTFISSFDANNNWLLTTPFNASLSNFKEGMIVQVSETTGLNPKCGVYIIQTLTANGFILKQPGYTTQVGRGPGITFGSNVLRVTILDFYSVIIDSYQKSYAVVSGQIATSDNVLSKLVDNTVVKLTLLQLTSLSEELVNYFGLGQQSKIQVEQRLMDELKSDYLRALAGELGNSIRWTKLVR